MWRQPKVLLLLPSVLVWFCFQYRFTTRRLMVPMQPLKSLVVNACSKHTATVIFIHGLGDTGYGWKPVADMFQKDSAMSHIRWVLPHAPTRSVTANMGIEMPSWFDILSFGFESPEDEEGMIKTVSSINTLISDELSSAGFDAGRIILGGFSQGGAMSLLAGLTSETKLGGVAVLSGWLPLKEKFETLTAPHASQIPLFWGHGTSDPLVLHKFGTESVDNLISKVGFSRSTGVATGLDFRTYEGMAHTTCPTELKDLSDWIKRVVPKSSD